MAFTIAATTAATAKLRSSIPMRCNHEHQTLAHR
jgi:hypothetical protein